MKEMWQKLRAGEGDNESGYDVDLYYTPSTDDTDDLTDYHGKLKELRGIYKGCKCDVIVFNEWWEMLRDPNVDTDKLSRLFRDHGDVIHTYYADRENLFGLADNEAWADATPELINGFRIVIDLVEDTLLRIRAAGDTKTLEKIFERFPELRYVTEKWKDKSYTDSQGWTWIIHDKSSKGG